MMQIEYLTKMKNTPKIGKRENEGVSEEEISRLENKLNVTLPKAYKEFLLLGGRYDNIINNFELDFDGLESMQKLAKEKVETENLDLKNFWCFAEYGDFDSFMFFLLNDGENPAVYSFIAEKGLLNDKNEPVSYLKFRNSFNEYIDRCIDEALNDK
ncbi:SMI1/KNR4 family protein [Sphingobacterium sp. SRCM116780]|uniref:SMI1/KNR4 family protein n=1 Tax=Sphingobacterium sp. SRCM116780 TaxID=2907623 RepID=UPI001F2ED4A9|nr:SMI1/KNR4 family protein [Sphingobacterium sp. SRCM116780]UIR55062.1 SMI1/KNR4 family protein [Sphingobacterium sp. SRCM116780]